MTLAMRHADYGQAWGEGAARYFYLEGDFLDESQGMRLMPVPDSFFCPISAAIMSDPVSTVDGCAYEREYIERWFRERRQQRQTITSPATGLELLSTTLMPLMALQRAIEAYLAHRPEIKQNMQAGRSFEEAAQALQADLFEKQAMNASVHDEVRRLREANRALRRALERSEERYAKVLDELLLLKGMSPEKRQVQETAALPEVLKSVASSASANIGGGEEQPKPTVELSACTEAVADVPASAPAQDAGKTSEKDPTIAPSQAAPDLSGAESLARSIEDASVDVEEQSAATPPLVEAGVSAAASSSVVPASASITSPKENAVPVAATSPPRAAAEGAAVSPLEEASASAPRRAAEPPQSGSSSSSTGVPASGGSEPLPADSAGAARAVSVRAAEEPAGLSTAAVVEVSRRTSTSAVRTHGSSSGMRREESKKHEAEHVPRSRDPERSHSRLENSSPNGIVARPACLPAPLSSRSEKTSCTDRDHGPISGNGADRNTPAFLSGLVLLLTVGIIALILRLQPVDPDSDRIRQIRDFFNAPALLSPLVTRRADTASYLPPLTTDMRSEELVTVTTSADSPVNAVRSKSATLQAEEMVRDKAGDADVSRGEVELIKEHIEKLRSGSFDEKVQSASALEVLASKGSAEQAAIARGGAVRLLVELVRSEGRPEVRGIGAAALGALVAGSAENQKAAVRAGAIPTLVKLLKAGMAPKTAAAALRHLASNNAKNQVAIVRAGAIAPLVELMTNGAPEARLEAAAALEDLAREKLYEKQVAFVQAGAIPPLIRLLPDKAAGVRRASASMLCMLATDNADNQVAIAQAGAILPLVTLLTDAEAEVRKDAAAALGRLSFFETEANHGNQAGIGQAGAIPLLVGLLQDPSPEVRATAAGTLRDLATSNAENQIRMLNAEVSQPLLLLLRSEDKVVQETAMSLVRNLADNNAENQLALARAGVLARLLQLLKVPQSQGEATRALASLARNCVENQVALKQAGVNLEPHVREAL